MDVISQVNGGRCSIEDVLELQGIAFCDKVAMALLYLPMHRLMAFVDKLLNDSWASGSLYGLLCTGISAERDSVSLIQNYLDRSSDVQTAAVLFILNGSFAFSLQRSSVVYRIVNSYLTLLDSWQLWKERAELHQAIANHDPNNILNLPCTVLGCSYCQQPIYSSPIRLNQWHTRVAYCPECKRPLPQCALCSLNVGFAPSCKQGKPPMPSPQLWLQLQ
ncbi:hypothetical protein D918_01412 [Trichuris suis]|nr:hypothetical protein D918_01412 [Trichuris suis]